MRHYFENTEYDNRFSALLNKLPDPRGRPRTPPPAMLNVKKCVGADADAVNQAFRRIIQRYTSQ